MYMCAQDSLGTCPLMNVRTFKRSNVPTPSRVDLVEHARERYGFAQVWDAADPGHKPLYAHAEAGVGHRTVLTQVQVPLESFAGEVMLLYALLHECEVVYALRAAADFAIA